MWTLVVFLALSLTFVSGSSTSSSFKGCYSSSIVEEFAFYYKIGQSLPLEECFAACNNRLTTQIGLKVDDSSHGYNFVYCGNDLLNVSLKVDDSRCLTCEENNGLFCGGDDIMAVYSLRDSSPFALLLATDRGVEMLIDNTTTLRVAYESDSPYKYVDYIYNKDMVISVVGYKLLRSVYNAMAMKFSEPYTIASHSFSTCAIAVDYSRSTAYIGFHGDTNMYTHKLESPEESKFVISAHEPKHISVDPYGRRIVFTKHPFDAFYTVSLDNKSVERQTINHLDKIDALAMDTDDGPLYAILTLKGDNTTFLVQMTYDGTQMRKLFSGPQLANARVLKVYLEHAVWLVRSGNSSIVYTCLLNPKCSPENLSAYQTTKNIYDLTIYGPTRQTPGQRICDPKQCSYGCRSFTPFSAKCYCPTGMKLVTNNTTCSALNATLVNNSSTVNSTSLTSDISEGRSPEHNNAGPSICEQYFVISIVILSILLLALAVLVVKLYIRNAIIYNRQAEQRELNNMNDECVGIL